MNNSNKCQRLALIVFSVILITGFIGNQPMLSYGATRLYSPANAGANSNQGPVERISVDNTTPAHSVVTYRLDKGTISSATFYGPDSPNGVTQTSIGAGYFQFIFNQDTMYAGTYNFTLKYTFEGSSQQHQLSFTGTCKYNQPSESKSASYYPAWRPVLGAATLMTVSLTHSVTEIYRKITYTIPLTPKSKHIWVGTVNAQVGGEHSYDLPDTYTESHSYEDASGQQYLYHASLPGGSFAALEPYRKQKSVTDSKMLPDAGGLTGETSGVFLYYLGENLQAGVTNAMSQSLDPIDTNIN
jgi:hypothetical protein